MRLSVQQRDLRVGRRVDQLGEHLAQRGRRRRAQSAPRQPHPQRVRRARGRQRAEPVDVERVGAPAGAGRQVLDPDLVEQRLRRGRVLGGAGEARRDRRCDASQRRHHFVADRVARMAPVLVRRIVDERQAVQGHVLAQRGGAGVDEGPQQQHAVDRAPARGRRESADAGPAREVDQHRLGLVVAVMRGHQHRRSMPRAEARERRVADAARLSFDRGGLRVDGDVLAVERDTEVGGSGAAMREPRVGRGQQPVMDVQRERVDDAACLQHRHRVQQCGGVGAAAIGDRDADRRVARREGRGQRRIDDRIERRLRARSGPCAHAAPSLLRRDFLELPVRHQTLVTQ